MYAELWNLAETKQRVAVSSLSPDIVHCLENGDGVHDHYGGRSPFVVLECRGSRYLVLCRDSHPNQARVAAVVNATGGYGTGILGGAVAELIATAMEAAPRSACTTDEHHSIDRMLLSRTLRQVVAEHTGTEADSWNLTFTSTGTEAMDFALQFTVLEGYNLATGSSARSRKDVIVACHGAWHGWGMNPLQLLDRRQFTDGFPKLGGFTIVHIPYGSLPELEAVFVDYRGRIRAVFAEGLLGDGGIIAASREWWSRLRILTQEEDARMVVDEILTGLRAGGALAMPRAIGPDCVVMGKALGLGLFPMAAVLWRKASMTPRPGVGVRTFNARPWNARVTCEGLRYILRNRLFERSVEIGNELRQCLVSVIQENPHVYKAIRGQGLIIGIELAGRYSRNSRVVRDTLLLEGVMTETESGILGRRIPPHLRVNQTIRMTPPLTIPREEIPIIVSAFRQAALKLMDGPA